MLIDGADCKALSFDFEPYLAEKLDFCLDPSARPRKAEICKFFLRGTCQRGNSCPMNHGKSDKALLCKHWLRGLCKKGDLCEYLHEYNLKKMPECWFFSKYGECSNAECLFLHIDPTTKQKECVWYSRGFCKHGPTCRNKHIKKMACFHYLTGFCPEGQRCQWAHPKFDVPASASTSANIIASSSSSSSSGYHDAKAIAV